MFTSSDIKKIEKLKFPFPYIPEKFTAEEKKILLQYFTNTDKPIFAIHNLPQEVVGAMFSRYSRSSKSVRRLFLDEFRLPDEAFLSDMVLASSEAKSGLSKNNLKKTKERTSEFYKKVFAEYGDDSVIQMGSVHVAFEFVSHIIGAKAIEDQRIGAAYIEKSTRYVDFGKKVNGHFLFMTPPEIKRTSFEKKVIDWSNLAFGLFNKNLPLVADYLRQKYPFEKMTYEDAFGKTVMTKSVKGPDRVKLLQMAYERALRAKAFDTARFFLPTTLVTNLGAHFSGHSAENAVNKMLSSPYKEANILGCLAHAELQKVSANFFQNVDFTYGQVSREYRRNCLVCASNMFNKYQKYLPTINNEKEPKVSKLISFDSDADIKLASQILYSSSDNRLSKEEILKWCRNKKNNEKSKSKYKSKKEMEFFSPTLIKIILDSVPNRKQKGITRRQKLPRTFEQVFAEVEFFTDIGTYKDLQRNRMSTTERQTITANDLYIPVEYKDKVNKDILRDYLLLAKKTKALSKKLAKIKKYKHVSEYVSIMGNKIRFNIKANLRQWVFFAELRTISGGHPTYRFAMQEVARQIIDKMPFMKSLFARVDWTPDYGLGRLKAEIATQEKLKICK